MLLRTSALSQNRDCDLNTVTGAVRSDAGVPHGRLLVLFAEALLGEDDAALADASADFRAALGLDRFAVAARSR